MFLSKARCVAVSKPKLAGRAATHEKGRYKMDSRQTKKLSAHRGLSATLDAHKPKWTSLGAFKRAVTAFNDCIDSIDDLARIQADKSGAGAEKALCLVALATDAHTIASAVSALASDNNDASLAAKVAFSRSDLKRGREAEIVTRCENIHAAAVENLDALDDEYGVTQAKLTALQQKIDAFRTAQPKPRRTRASSSAATQQLRDCFAQADKIAHERLDKLAVQFETSEPAFFNEFTSARKIGQVGSRSSKDKQEALPLPKAA